MNNTEKLDINTYYNKDDESYITDCQEYMNVIGCGDTEEESLNDFITHLKVFLEAKSKNKAIIVNKGGRPKKNNTRLSYNVKPETKQFISALASVRNLNEGAIIDEIVTHFKNCSSIDKSLSKKPKLIT